MEFGRELNATEDRPHFTARPAGPGSWLPVVEGKHVSPFIVDARRRRSQSIGASPARCSNRAGRSRRARLAYRDVASPSNVVTLIAAIVPAGVVTTHTLFCLRTPLD